MDQTRVTRSGAITGGWWTYCTVLIGGVRQRRIRYSRGTGDMADELIGAIDRSGDHESVLQFALV